MGKKTWMAEEHEDKGLLGQNTALRGRLVTSSEELDKLKAVVEENKRVVSLCLERLKESEKERAQDKLAFEEKLKQTKELYEQTKEQQKKDKEELMTFVNAKLTESREFYQKEVELANQVRRRVALAEARIRVCNELGRPKGKETWSEYIGSVTADEWKSLDLVDDKVKKLLQDGAFPLNRSVHDIPPEEIMGSIYIANLENRDA